jgi:hypothetical protein
MELLLDRLADAAKGQPSPPRSLQTAQDVIDLLQEQVESLRAASGLATVEKARAIGYLAGLARKAIETGTLEGRLEMLERVLNPRKGQAP